MLIKFTVENYRSFRDEHTWSLVADEDRDAPETGGPDVPLVEIPKVQARVLPSAVVYGPNASGKTNLLRALDAMRRIVLNSARAGQRGDVITAIEPFQFDPDRRTEPTRFEIVFIQEDVRFRYGFTATRERVMEEWLYAALTTREQTWFVRDETDRTLDEAESNAGVEFGSRFEGEMKVIQRTTRPNALVLSTAAQLNTEKVAPVFDWFRDSLRYIPGQELPPFETVEALKSDQSRSQVLHLFREAGLGIEDVRIEEHINGEGDDPFIDRIHKALARELGEEVSVQAGKTRVEIVHRSDTDSETALNLIQESQGTQRYFALTGPLLNALQNGQTLVVDELDASMHPMMVRAIVGLFHDEAANPNGAQLLFNTHDVTLLDADLFRRDQVWFTEKFDDGATELYGLLEFEEPEDRSTRQLARRYLNGRYGAIPILRLS